jgi:glycine cleavage system H lipoate-binding protein
MYDTTHTWAFMENDGMVKVGVDDFLHHIFGKIDQVKKHPNGKAFKKGESLTTFIHKGKQISIQSPVSGKIIAVNEAFSTKNPDVTSNWLYKIEPTNWKRESSFLLMVDSYTDWMKSEFNRFKVFLNTAMHQHSPQHAYIALQDGGELQEGLMTGLEPAVWEDFQQQFLKASR